MDPDLPLIEALKAGEDLALNELIQRHRLHSLPLDEATVCEAAALPPVHGDRFDRVLIALAKARHLPLVTSDQTIARYPGIQTFW